MDMEEFLSQRAVAVSQVASTSTSTGSSTSIESLNKNLEKIDTMRNVSIILGILFWIVIIVVIAKKVKKNKGNSKKQTTNSNFSSEEKRRVKDYKIDSWAEFIKIAVISGICGYIGYLIGANTDECFIYVWCAAGLPWGYSVMDKIIDDIAEIYFALASSTLWLVMVIIKFGLALLLGAIIMPIKIIISLYNIIQAHKLSKEVNSADVLTENTEEVVSNNINEMQDTKAQEKGKGNGLDNIRTLKELMDEGVITQEEFESKKKDILDKI